MKRRYTAPDVNGDAEVIVHAHYDDLCTLLSELKKKMRLYHYQPHPTCQADADGFAGFVKKDRSLCSDIFLSLASILALALRSQRKFMTLFFFAGFASLRDTLFIFPKE